MTAFENLNWGKTPNRKLRAIGLPIAGALALTLAFAHGENVQVGQVNDPTPVAADTFMGETSAPPEAQHIDELVLTEALAEE